MLFIKEIIVKEEEKVILCKFWIREGGCVLIRYRDFGVKKLLGGVDR